VAELARQGSLPCGRCLKPILPTDRWHLDHVDDEGQDSTSDEVTRPSHEACNLLAGKAKQRRLAVEASRQRLRPVIDVRPPVVEAVDGETGGMTRQDGQTIPWLSESLDIAVWPRLMTTIRPDAVGSLGADVIDEIEQAAGRQLWPWQRLVLLRALEVDAAGRLVWRNVAVSVPRQMGKSTMVGEAASWRLRNGLMFGEPQDVLHVARDVGAAVQVQRPHRVRAERDRRYKVRNAGGRLEIEHVADGGRWLIRSVRSVYSYSASMAIVDEGWDVEAEVVDDGISPVLLQRDQAQLWLVSTANAQATSLMLGRRAAALAELDAPARTLWIEWSAPPAADVSDPAVWQSAVPHWSEHIAEFYAEKYSQALSTRASDPTVADPVRGFAEQYLNQWPRSVEPVRKGEPLVDPVRWAAAHKPRSEAISLEQVYALDEHWDGGVSVAGAGQTDGGFWLTTTQHPTRQAAFDAVPAGAPKVLASEVLLADLRVAGIRATPVGAQELAAAVPIMRNLIADDRLRHDGSSDLAEQVGWSRAVVGSLGQLHLQPDKDHRLDTVRAALWALGWVAKPRPRPGIF
jgi:hypothetical protein